MSVNFDHDRKKRTGISEVILAEPKLPIDLEEAIEAALTSGHPLLITRIIETQIELIESVSKFHDVRIEWDKYQRTAILGDFEEEKNIPKVAILSGGTSDQPIVEEIQFCLSYYRISSVSFSDIGVAGIYRHQEVMKELLKNYQGVKLLIVVAGNEGALFSVISGQTKLPMIAVPTSIGYGFGGKGETALRSALQSCSPGVVTVNIDNGFGAATFAKKLLLK